MDSLPSMFSTLNICPKKQTEELIPPKKAEFNVFLHI
jgi:hypothetical protein